MVNIQLPKCCTENINQEKRFYQAVVKFAAYLLNGTELLAFTDFHATELQLYITFCNQMRPYV